MAPVSAAIERQRHCIGKQMLHEGIKRARKTGYKEIIVEGSLEFYNKLGFVTSTEFGIYASDKNLPASKEYLMAMELCKDGLKNISGKADYSIYNSLT